MSGSTIIILCHATLVGGGGGLSSHMEVTVRNFERDPKFIVIPKTVPILSDKLYPVILIFNFLTQCVIPEKIHTHPMEGHWKFLRGMGS